MGFFKILGYVGAVALAPMTGGASLVVVVATGAAGAIGTAKAVKHVATAGQRGYERGRAHGLKEGTKAAEAELLSKYNDKLTKLTERFRAYQNMEEKLVAMYALGIAVANCDGTICDAEMADLETFALGASKSHLPPHLKAAIKSLATNPPTIAQAHKFALEANLPYEDMEDLIYIVANADGNMHSQEEIFMSRWKTMAMSKALV